jgi:hypothetical protein
VSQSKSPGQQLASALLACLEALKKATSPRVVINDVNHDGRLLNGLSISDFVARTTDVLAETGKVYRLGSSWFLELGNGEGRELKMLANEGRVDVAAAARLAGFVQAGVETKEGSVHRLLPNKLISTVLLSAEAGSRLPEIREYARRAMFDDTFALRGPGWHPDKKILVHGVDITPAADAAPAGASALERIPPFTRRALKEFCWATEADLVNALGFLLTGLLVNRFVETPHPVGLLDGNQKGVGKTLFVDVLGILLDGVEPRRIRLCSDDELEKKLGANLRDSPSSILFFDNVRQKIDSTVLEQNALSPILSIRQLGHSANITRPNSFLWVVTSNRTEATEDFVSRVLPIRLRYEGDPKERDFDTDPGSFAREHRQEILGELAGMVLAWKSAGMLPGIKKHRCKRWAEVVGGILGAAGLGDLFLGNLREVEETMDEGLKDLTALATHVIDQDLGDLFTEQGALHAKGKRASEWLTCLREAGVLPPAGPGATSQSDTTRAGTFLSGKVNRRVQGVARRGPFSAKLCCKPGRSNQKLYLLEVTFDQGSKGPDELAATPSSCKALPPLPLGGPPPAEAWPGEVGNALDWGV